MSTEPVFVGIDVSKASLDVAVHRPAARWAVDYTEADRTSLVARLTALAPALIVLEATGGLESPLVGALATAGLPVVVVNPRQVRDFAKATGHLAKTEPLDAAVLAHFFTLGIALLIPMLVGWISASALHQSRPVTITVATIVAAALLSSETYAAIRFLGRALGRVEPLQA